MLRVSTLRPSPRLGQRAFNTFSKISIDPVIASATMQVIARAAGQIAGTAAQAGFRMTWAKAKTVFQPHKNDDDILKNLRKPLTSGWALANALERDKYVMFVGPSSMGKTTTIAKFFSLPFCDPENPSDSVGFPVVCHIDLRYVKTEKALAEALERALYGKASNLQMTPGQFIDQLKEAFDKIRQENPQISPAVWVEDIHAAPDEVIEPLCALLMGSKLPIIYSDSNHEGFGKVRSFSGQATRLKLHKMICLTEPELMEGLTMPREWTEIVATSLPAGPHQDADLLVAREPVTRRGPSICDMETANYLVEHLGANIGQVMSCVDPGKGPQTNTLESVKIKVQAVLTLEAGKLAEIAGRSGLTRPHILVASHLILNALLASKGEAVNADKLLLAAFDEHDLGLPTTAVETLILKNVLSYSSTAKGYPMVVANYKSILHSWKLAKKDPDYNLDSVLGSILLKKSGRRKRQRSGKHG